jgi:CheY-like chemotaxis protein
MQSDGKERFEAVRSLVLVVDDDLDAVEAIAAVLDANGYGVVKASNGEEALQRLRAGLVPSVIVLDLRMPGNDGWDFRAAQLHDTELAHIPVVIYSGLADVDVIAATLRADGVSVKPAIESLMAEVARCARPPES